MLQRFLLIDCGEGILKANGEQLKQYVGAAKMFCASRNEILSPSAELLIAHFPPKKNQVEEFCWS